MRRFLTSIAFFMMGAFAISPGYADIFDKRVENAKQAEARGDLVLAQNEYYGLATSYVPGRPNDRDAAPYDLARLAGRRSLALTLILFQQNHPAYKDPRHIANHYKIMRGLEPGNATWPYLQAQLGLKVGAFDQVPANLRCAAACPFGDASIREKAKADYAKYSGQIAKVQRAEQKEYDEHFDPVKWHEMQRAGLENWHPEPTKRPEDPPMSASQRAYQAGDYGASQRLQAGNGNSRDVGLYSKWSDSKW